MHLFYPCLLQIHSEELFHADLRGKIPLEPLKKVVLFNFILGE